MRRIVALIMVLMLAALPTGVLQTPAPTHAAQNVSYYTTLTGKIVAVPAVTTGKSRYTFLLQSGNRTVVVVATNQTQLTDRYSTQIRMSDLHDRADVRVTGNYNGVQIHATQIQNLSLPVQLILQITGKLVAPLPASWQTGGPLCISDAQFPNVRRILAVTPLGAACGGNLALYLTSSTKIMDRSGQPISLTALRVNNTLEITATLRAGRFTASLVKDTSSIPSTTILTGLLVATPQNLNSTGDNQFLLQVGDRTVVLLVSSQTQLVNSNSAPISMGDLHDRAQLQVTGIYDGVRIRASRIQDLSMSSPVAVVIKGQLAGPLPASWPTSGPLCIANAQFSIVRPPLAAAPMATPCGANLPVYLTIGTAFVHQFGSVVPFSALQAGDTLVVTATLNVQTGQFVASNVQDLSLPHSGTLQVAGQLAMPLPVTGQTAGPLCVANALITGYQPPLVRAQSANPCGGTLAVYLTSSTVIENNSGNAVSFYALHAGDSLSITAALISGQYTATFIQDHSI